MTAKICSVGECGRKHYGHGLCAAHYARQRRSGTVSEDTPVRSPGRPVIDRFMEKVRKNEGGCWIWIGSLSNKGYGQLGVGRRDEGLVTAHRWSYEHFIGPIPDGLWVLHHCDVKACVNPEHLYVGTLEDNMRDVVERGRSKKIPPTACKNGHEYVQGSWTWRPSSDGRYQYRACKECHRQSQLRYMRRKRGK